MLLHQGQRRKRELHKTQVAQWPHSRKATSSGLSKHILQTPNGLGPASTLAAPSTCGAASTREVRRGERTATVATAAGIPVRVQSTSPNSPTPRPLKWSLMPVLSNVDTSMWAYMATKRRGSIKLYRASEATSRRPNGVEICLSISTVYTPTINSPGLMNGKIRSLGAPPPPT